MNTSCLVMREGRKQPRVYVLRLQINGSYGIHDMKLLSSSKMKGTCLKGAITPFYWQSQSFGYRLII